MPAIKEELNAIDLLTILTKNLEQQARKPNIFGYEPHNKQKLFHKLVGEAPEAGGCLYIGGNRSGKSYGAVAEDLIWALHLRDDIPNEPIRGRVVAVDIDRGIKQLILPIFKILTPAHKLKGGNWDKAYQKKENVLNFADGGFIEFMSYEQATEKFAGTSRHFIHFDEEPPKHIWTECLARLVDTGGKWWISMTPVEGLTWVFEDIYEPTTEAADKVVLVEESEDGSIGQVIVSESEEMAIVEVGMNENPHLSASARNSYLKRIKDANEREARSKGKFIQRAGKVFGMFSEATHVYQNHLAVPRQLQADGWQIYSSVDHGWNAPTAWLWHAVSASGRVITFGEHYKSEMTIEQHSRVVKEKEKAWGLDSEEILRTGDPAMKQHQGVTGTSILYEYARHGIYISVDTVPRDASIGMNVMQGYFHLREDGKPMWEVSDECVSFIKELKNLKFAMYTSKKVREDNNPQEKVHKKNDHAYDSAKYFATMLPELAPEADTPRTEGDNIKGVERMKYDPQHLKRLADDAENAQEKTEWITLESYN